MDYLDSLDSSSKLAPICQKSFINKFYLILLNGKICFDVIGAKNSWWKQIHVFCIDNMYICIIRMGQASRAFLPQPAKSWKAWRKMCNIWQDKEDACVRSSSVAARLDQESSLAGEEDRAKTSPADADRARPLACHVAVPSSGAVRHPVPLL